MDVIKLTVETECHNFWNALKIYHHQPKAINKQVLFSEDVFIAKLPSSLTFSECHDFFLNFSTKLEESTPTDFVEILNSVGVTIIEKNDFKNDFSCKSGMFLIVRKIIPKLNANNIDHFEYIFLDKCTAKVYIFTKHSVTKAEEFKEVKNQDPFVILKFNFLQLVWSDKHIDILYDKNLNEKGIAWLQATFASKFRKLLSSFDFSEDEKKRLNKLQFVSQVDIIQFYKLYEEMKTKYAKYFIDNWTENTDPKKFVYEDIGIATYLMLLWNQNDIPDKNLKKQKFLDLGCGNGLLVHILNSEGHLGVGLDMRRRKIWDIYPPSTVLKEETIIPTAKTKHVDADWLIGNHSDELTAWIPIMARHCSSKCQYFVLPCCPYELSGMKFQRKNSSFSSYQDFISYVKGISELCGFETFVDKLRIPSTKRICLVGLNKHEVLKDEYNSLKEGISRFISQEGISLGPEGEVDSNKSGNKDPGGNDVLLNFKPRESVEPVRNCTKLPQEVIDSLLKTVMTELLKEKVTCTVIKDGETSTWNRGRKLPIGELASCLNEMLLKQLKKECKGLQTLLKNHHFLFEVSQGFVQFRSPDSMLALCNKFLESQNETKWKVKKCWFFNNHPDKCPLSNDVCSYSHSQHIKEI